MVPLFTPPRIASSTFFFPCFGVGGLVKRKGKKEAKKCVRIIQLKIIKFILNKKKAIVSNDRLFKLFIYFKRGRFQSFRVFLNKL